MNDEDFVFGIHLTSHGFGWILFEAPNTPADWGTTELRHDKHDRALFRLEQLLDRYDPGILVMEQFDDPNMPRYPRIRKLASAVAELAKSRGMQVKTFSRKDVLASLPEAANGSRQAIARAVVERVEALRTWLPDKRAIWQREKGMTAVFSAAACVLAWHARQP